MNGCIKIIQAAQESARVLVEQLEAKRTDRLVIAESCTAGLVAGILGQIPGISKWLCGSAVTYRESAKREWLGVSTTTLANHHAESIETTSEMALGVLRKTTEAKYSVAVTGHLGPNAPPAMDGRIFIAVAVRSGEDTQIYSTHCLKLNSLERVTRQYESVDCVLSCIEKAVAAGDTGR